jgi:phage replication-related protein YjqB (UPF0714/DUF867 family)
MAQDRYASFAALARQATQNVHYRITALRRASTIAIIAPHAGAIEKGTGEIARAVAGSEFNLYLFEGIMSSENYSTLHITSNRFDEPSCLELIRECSTVISIHGCQGRDERVNLGGCDLDLKLRLADALGDAGIRAETDGHPFPGSDPNNICNRGRTGRGVQVEISDPLRGGRGQARIVQAIRTLLLSAEQVT